MKRLSREHAWSLLGLAAVAISVWLLYHQLHGLRLDHVLASLRAIPATGWTLAALATLVAYAALAGYDRLALMHLRKRVSWPFIVAASFTAYAIGHNVGASVLSGGVVRYRAYRAKGLRPLEVGVLVAFCTFTFVLGAVLLGGVVLLWHPELLLRLLPQLPPWLPRLIGLLMLLGVALYIAGSRARFKPLKWRGFRLRYPHAAVAWRQLFVGPLELAAAAAIIHFVLPEAGHPGYIVVLGMFLASFSAALISHAPGGLGVLEVVFLLGLPELPKADVLAALLIFRLFYLLLPFALSIGVILLFERSRWLRGLTTPAAAE
ncbi:MAG TPA: lysylphosphatidylglycerol synthase domain-containing protein [Arenimonas sp.]|nr:lysylphosphatidylglycerol synthase domain-containing protein [Arenimonas sp.]